MKIQRPLVLIAVVAMLGALQVAVAVPSAGGGSLRWLSLSAAAFELRDETTHYATHCTPGASDDREFQGTVNGGGGYVLSVELPQGATIDRFLLTARDNDGDLNVHAYLLRKRMAPQAGLDGFGGYRVVAQVSSNGASQLLRRFTDPTIAAGGTVDHAQFALFAEIVNCGDTTEPIGVQIAYQR